MYDKDTKDIINSNLSYEQKLNKLERLFQHDYEVILERLRPQLENNNSWEIAAAPMFISTSGDVGGLTWDGIAAWTSYSIKLGERSSLILHLRGRTEEHVADSDHEDEYIEQDSILYGMRYRRSFASSSLSVEGVFVHTDPEKGETDNYGYVDVGYDLRLAKDAWLNISVGSEIEKKQNNSVIFGLAVKLGEKQYVFF
jgi:hypothetical protein